MTNQEICTSISVLIKSCNEVATVFRCAADNVQSPELSVIITALGNSSQQRARELQNHLVELGGHTPARGHRGLAAQRAWVSLRKMFFLNVDLEMLKECKSCENKAISQYLLALDEPLPEFLHTLIQRQYLVVKCNSARIGDLIVLEQTVAPRCYRQSPLSGGRHLRTGQELDA